MLAKKKAAFEAKEGRRIGGTACSVPHTKKEKNTSRLPSAGWNVLKQTSDSPHSSCALVINPKGE